ncbi:MAG TPA: DUF3810 family protein [Candidatus Hydrogenedentes bacterium]|nr:DUF3810 family protein [Candidatus Hydrogenedentota bacterium]
MTEPLAESAPSKPAHSVRWRFWVFILFLYAVAGVWFLFTPAQDMVEKFFTRGWYRVMVGVMTPLTQWAPFSIALMLTIALIAGFPILWIGNWIYLRRWKKRSHWAGLLWGPKWAIAAAPVLIVWFVVFWGAGYQRVPVEKRLDLPTQEIQDTEAAQLRALLLAVIKRDLPPPEARDVNRTVAAIASTMKEVVAAWDGRAITMPSRVKATPKGFLLFNGTSGMCSPYTLEAQVDGGLPDAAFVHVAAHELGHIAGFCKEDEATLIGFVAGLRAGDPFARYACALDAYMDLARQLKKDEYKTAIEALPETAREDLKKANDAYKKYRITWFSQISWRVYDKYLQSQGIKEGRKNYSRGITLFTYVWRKGLVTL